jgi:hypothetical protein
MSSTTTILVIFNAIVFMIWTVLMFHALLTLRAKAIKRTKTQFPRPVDTLHEVGLWLRDPTSKPTRMRLLFLSLVMISLSAIVAFTSTPSS